MLVSICWSCGHVGIDLQADETADETLELDDASRSTEDPSDPSDESPSDKDETDEDPTDGDSSELSDELSDESDGEWTTDDSELADAGPDGGAPITADAGDASATDVDHRDAATRRDAGAYERDASTPDVRDASSKDPPDAANRPDPDPIERDAAIAPMACLPDCTCDNAASCDFICNTADCQSTCAAGSTCTLDVNEATNVDIACREGAVCQATGSRAGATTYVCEGSGECRAHCGAAETCVLSCLGSGKCVLDCAEAADCTLHCGELALCTMIHPDTDTQVELGCPEDARKECSSSLLTCNTDCP